MRILIFIVLLSNFVLAQETTITLTQKDSLNVDKIQQDKLQRKDYLKKFKGQPKGAFKDVSERFSASPESNYADNSENKVLGIEPGESSHNHTLRGPSQYDSRIEIFQLNKDSLWQNNIHIAQMSVGIVVDKKMLSKVSKDYYQLNINNTLGSLYNLCASVPFQNQPVVGVGTAFLIDKNRMITANHVFDKNIEHYAIVFDFFMSSENGVINPLIKKENIYYPDKILKKKTELDMAVFTTKKEVQRPSLKISEDRILKKGTQVYSIGHPSGLPKKILLNASVLENKHPYYFYTSLDSFQGNSGSPVLDFKTNKVIGVLVSGEIDYKFNGNCYTINICGRPKCKGEKVIKIERVLND
ncbi:serine protease [Wenyingzhuangia sp. 2_MG-2023]|uniref:S1 family peptidase n=1 Tax=Wenyingzhuangia sp. 2_MG-2023 TaxID=3062639 RepID=UPI0026E34110|nr:serine protease [Wenyingzhuangia sp. 2_MG-2023]MDO6739355.1 serine protease [Wenyingzhuangia sp. 2_MG-2023]